MLPIDAIESAISLPSSMVESDCRFPKLGVRMNMRYGFEVPVFDADVRVVIVVEPTSYVAVDGGLTASELAALTQLLDQPAVYD